MRHVRRADLVEVQDLRLHVEELGQVLAHGAAARLVQPLQRQCRLERLHRLMHPRLRPTGELQALLVQVPTSLVQGVPERHQRRVGVSAGGRVLADGEPRARRPRVLLLESQREVVEDEDCRVGPVLRTEALPDEKVVQVPVKARRPPLVLDPLKVLVQVHLPHQPTHLLGLEGPEVATPLVQSASVR